MTSRMHRRSFLARTIGTGAGLMMLPSAVPAWSDDAGKPLNLAVVGVGGYAAHHAFLRAVHLYDNLEVVALCDVDERRVPPVYEFWRERADEWAGSSNEAERRAAGRYRRLLENRPAFFADFRRMLDEMDDRIDAVVCATPDHTHAVVSAAAMRAGRHVFTEKPLTITVHEARALRELAAESGVATSMGNQGTQSPQFRRGVELIREGVIGPVEEVHVWFSRGGQDHRRPPEGTEPVPEKLHWDLWLGPVASRPYHPRWIARNHWRETSAGELGNFGPHTANMAFMALDVQDLWRADSTAGRSPIRVSAEFARLNRLSFPRWEVIRWQVPARGGQPPVTFHWHHGPTPRLAPGSNERLLEMLTDLGLSKEDAERRLRGAGAVIVGGRGAIVTTSHNTEFVMLPEERFRDVEQDRPKTLAPSRGHYQDWVHACRGGEPAWASFDYAATLNEFLMLGAVATQFEAELEYDPAAGRIVNHPEADEALGYEYRQGWSL
jgi:predicted dehydrogenase